jgi:hypothetical protein
MNNQTYPTFQEIKEEISKKELLEIMQTALEIGLDEAIKDYIEATYYTYEEVA